VPGVAGVAAMPELSFSNLLWVCAIAFIVPLLQGLFPRVRIPAVVLEIVAGIVVGPSVLGWVEADQAVQVLEVLGLAFLLFVGGWRWSWTGCGAARSGSPSPASA